jgi:RNA polymerase sigma-70 factor (ECF subfamily)
MSLEYLRYLPQGYDKRAVLNDLMAAYGKDVWNYAFSLARQKELADDITQDVFLKSYNNMHAFRGEASIRTWLLRITRNVAIDYRRSAFFRKVTLIDYIFDKRTQPSAEREAMDQIVYEDVWNKVLSLPTKHREVLVLYAHHHLSIAEIAATLEISEGTVKSRLHHARLKVSKLLKESDGDE